MKALTEYILQFCDLSKQQTDLIESKVKFRKDDYLSRSRKNSEKGRLYSDLVTTTIRVRTLLLVLLKGQVFDLPGKRIIRA